MIRSRVSSVAVLCILPVISACYGLFPGPQVGSTPINGSERVTETSQEVHVGSRPSAEGPELEIRVVRLAQVAYDVRLRHRAVRRPRVTLSIFGGLVGVGAGTAAALAGQRMTDADTVTTGGKLLTVAGALVGVASALGAIGAVGSDPESTREFVDGDRETRFRQEQPVGIPGVVVQVNVGVDTYRYESDARGIVTVDMAEDLGLSDFGPDPDPLTLGLSAPSLGIEREFELDPKTWTAPCVVTEGRGKVQREPTATSDPLGEYGAGDRFFLLGVAEVDWYGIEYRQSRGWIPRMGASRCRSVPS